MSACAREGTLLPSFAHTQSESNRTEALTRAKGEEELSGLSRLPTYALSTQRRRLPQQGTPPPRHSSQHGPQRPHHTASTAATPPHQGAGYRRGVWVNVAIFR